MKFEINISYSWGDEESPIEIEAECVEDAFNCMVDLATEEIKTSLREWREPHELRINPNDNEIIVWYGYDDERCYYKLKEINM